MVGDTPSSAISSRFYARCRQEVAATLETRGFSRRHDLLAQRTASGNWLVVRFQKSRAGTAAHVKLTLNVGVVSARLAGPAAATLAALATLSPDAWHLAERIGRWTSAGDDRWWSLSKATDVDVAADEIAHALGLAILALTATSSDEQLRDLWLSQRSPGLTDGQRLLNLGTMIAAIGPHELLPAVVDELRRLAPVMAHTLERRLAARYGAGRW